MLQLGSLTMKSEYCIGGPLDRKIMALHYEDADGAPFDPEHVTKRTLAAGRGVAMLSNPSYTVNALYFFWKSESQGYQVRRLYPDVDGTLMRDAFRKATSGRVESLIAIGLSYREIESLTGIVGRIAIDRAAHRERRGERGTPS